MYPILFKLGNFTIYTYGLFVFLGVIAAYHVCSRKSSKLGIDADVFSNIFFWTIILGFVGARIVYVLVEWKSFLSNPIGIGLGRSGFVFYGSVIFGFFALYFLARKYNVAFFKLLDILSLGAPLGQGLGRIGCFFYGCCYGRPGSGLLCILFPESSPAGFLGEKVIATQLISSFFLFLLFTYLALSFRDASKDYDGKVFLYYITFYSIFRFFIEFFRSDPRGYLFFLSTSQYISIFMVILVRVIFVWRSKKGNS